MNISEFVNKYGIEKKYKQGTFLFSQDEYCDQIFLINSGWLKAFYLSKKGKEFIKSFITKNNFIGNLIALHKREKTTFNLQCLTDCSVCILPFSEFVKEAELNLELSTFLNSQLINLAMKKERREYEFLCLSAEERYLSLCRAYPEIISKVTQNDIAKYLGITPVALSRIRSRRIKNNIN